MATSTGAVTGPSRSPTSPMAEAAWAATGPARLWHRTRSGGGMTPSVRAAEPGDLMDVARIWEQGWRDAHSGFVSPELVQARRGDSFATRTEDRLASTLVAVADSAVVGFVMVIEDEVEQLYLD